MRKNRKNQDSTRFTASASVFLHLPLILRFFSAMISACMALWIKDDACCEENMITENNYQTYLGDEMSYMDDARLNSPEEDE